MSIQSNNSIQNQPLRTAAFDFLRELQAAQERNDEAGVVVALDDLAERFGEELCDALKRAGHRATFVD